MESENEVKNRSNKLPVCATEYIKQVLKKMRYRRKVRRDMQPELAAHFEDELKDCETDEKREQKVKQLIAVDAFHMQIDSQTLLEWFNNAVVKFNLTSKHR